MVDLSPEKMTDSIRSKVYLLLMSRGDKSPAEAMAIINTADSNHVFDNVNKENAMSILDTLLTENPDSGR